MSGKKKKEPKLSLTVFIILVLLISGINIFIINSVTEPVYMIENSYQVEHKDDYIKNTAQRSIDFFSSCEHEFRPKTKHENIQSETKSIPINGYPANSDQIIGYYPNNSVAPHTSGLNNVFESRGNRNNSDLYYDLKITPNVNVNYSGFINWWVKIGQHYYPYYIAGEIDEKTVLSITIENVGSKELTIDDQAILFINLTDFYGRSSWEQFDYIGHLMPKERYTMDFTWIPKYSNRFNLSCYLSYSKDENNSNNQILVGNLYTKKWSEDFDDGNLVDWTGDLGEDKWHVTNSIEDDPNPNSHSKPYVLYHGLESISEKDDYGEKDDYKIITPEIDLRRFEENKATYLNFKFYGESNESLDTFSIEGYKPSEEKWIPLDLSFDSGKTQNQTSEPAWNFWISLPYIGIPIHQFNGELVKFKIHWQSDQSPESMTGFYFDDFFIYGYELPPPEYDLGIENIWFEPDNRPVMVNDEIFIKANITNYGTILATNIESTIMIRDLLDQQYFRLIPDIDSIEQIQAGHSKIISYKLIPFVAGIYYINLSLNYDLDTNLENNKISNFVIEVEKIYNSFEIGTDTWHHDTGWLQKDVLNDPGPDEHSRTQAWYISRVNISSNNTVDQPSDSYGQNQIIALYSPIIDLDGVQKNEIYKGNQLRVNFKYLITGEPEENLIFEYSIDNSLIWSIFPDNNDLKGIIDKTKTEHWQSWHWETKEQFGLFGHHVQFRWRYEQKLDTGSIDNIEPADRGFYIDDFSLWVIQESYDRPEISDIKLEPKRIINDGRNQVNLTFQVGHKSSSLKEVFIDLSPINGPEKYKFSFNQNIYNIHKLPYPWLIDLNIRNFDLVITVPKTVSKGHYILTISAISDNGLFDNDYFELEVRENTPPKILDYSPADLNITINEGEKLEFWVDAMDLEDGYGDELNYEWYIDHEKIIGQGTNRMKIETDYHGIFSSGSYSIKVMILDNGFPNKTIELEWSLNVLNILPDFEIQRDDLLISINNVTINRSSPINITFNHTLDLEIIIHNLQPVWEEDVDVYLIQQSSDLSVPDKVYGIYTFLNFSGNSYRILEISWLADPTYKYLKLSVDPELKIPEVLEDNNNLTIKINVSQPTPPNSDDNGNSNTPEINDSEIDLTLITVTALIITILCMAIAISTEVGSYQLILFFSPFYSRVTGKKVLEHKVRSKIYTYIRAHPGDHYRSIMAKLKIKNGTLVHHLSRLEQEELIKSERDGYYKRFYPVGMRIPRSEVGMYYPEGVPTYNIGEHQLSPIQMKIIKILRKYPGSTQKEIAQKIHESRRVVNYHIKLLEQDKLVRIIKDGRETQCYAVEKYSVSS